MAKENNQTAFSNFISESVQISGSISSSKDIMITGKVDGDINVQGRIIIGTKSIIKGDIIADSVEVAGTVHGTVKSNGKLVVKNSAVISGDLYTKLLLVEENAVLDGEIKMRDESAISEPVQVNRMQQVAETG